MKLISILKNYYFKTKNLYILIIYLLVSFGITYGIDIQNKSEKRFLQINFEQDPNITFKIYYMQDLNGKELTETINDQALLELNELNIDLIKEAGEDDDDFISFNNKKCILKKINKNFPFTVNNANQHLELKPSKFDPLNKQFNFLISKETNIDECFNYISSRLIKIKESIINRIKNVYFFEQKELIKEIESIFAQDINKFNSDIEDTKMFQNFGNGKEQYQLVLSTRSKKFLEKYISKKMKTFSEIENTLDQVFLPIKYKIIPKNTISNKVFFISLVLLYFMITFLYNKKKL